MEQIVSFIQQNAAVVLPIIGLWTVVWKGLALWKSSKKDHKVFFALLLVLNTLGLLEILYIFLLSKIDFSKVKTKFVGFFKKAKN
jgi:hypothetical protein